MYFLPQYKRGIFNRYRKGMPWLEMLSKDVSRLFFRIGQRLQGKRPVRILCHPHLPSRGATVFRIAKVLDMEVTNKPTGKLDLGFYWEYATYREEWQVLEARNDLLVINLQSRNIAKDFVDQRMKESFGYGAAINPEMHQGIAVRKSNTNAVHDGTIVTCPTTPEEGFFYMRLVDSRVSDLEVMDMRTPVMKDEIPHIYAAYRSSDARFVNVPPRVTLEVDVDQFLSNEEQQRIVHLAQNLGMDYCEFDILRDKDDGRIYVVDANNTPQGPPKNLSEEEKKISVQRLAESFKRQFLAELSKV